MLQRILKSFRILGGTKQGPSENPCIVMLYDLFFSSKKFFDLVIVAFSFVFGNYYPIMNSTMLKRFILQIIDKLWSYFLFLSIFNALCMCHKINASCMFHKIRCDRKF
jgi:hypothetical protein